MLRSNIAPGQSAAVGSRCPTQARQGAVNDTTCVNVVDRQGNAFRPRPAALAAFGDRGRYRHSADHAVAIVRDDARASQSAWSRQAPARDAESDAGDTRRQTGNDLSTPGGDNQDQALLQVFLNIIEFGMTPQEAVEAPRFQTEHLYSSFGNHEFVPARLNLESRIPHRTADALTALGHRVSVSGRLEQFVGAHGDLGA